MNERPTPETDLEHAQFAMGGFTLDFCQKLERERDEARNMVSGLSATVDRLYSAWDEAQEALARITEAAQAVVDRWEQPAWKDTEPTATVIYRLRDALGREAE